MLPFMRNACLLLLFVLNGARMEEDWNYNKGGMDWPGPSNFCGGLSQSPIMLDQSVSKFTRNAFLEINLSTNPVTTVLMVGKTLLLNGSFSALRFRDMNDTLLEFEGANLHFHAPGEHLVNQKLYDAEMHIVHKLKPEFENITSFRYAVIAVKFEAQENAANSFLEQLELDKPGVEKVIIMNQIFSSYFDTLDWYYQYQGSLTTPLCDETVYWFVFDRPLAMAGSQRAIIDAYFRNNPKFADGRGNNRILQRRHSRTINYAHYRLGKMFISEQ